ncbi:MAG TPA: hypothetical protein DCW68_00875 [Rhodospirillaceae bacterium]|nr:MAG: hypothetical protein A2018_00735 [Alphaproteobacteria bacterium GWF2_58_20]HAU28653.1 hypothetical protein [Rhodospirillaceae bacterium]
MKLRILFMSGILMTVAGGVPAFAGYLEKQAVSQKGPEAVLDWTSGILEVVGRATAPDRGSAVQREIMAIEAARAMAYKHLAESLHGVRVQAHTTVGNMARVMQDVSTAVNGMVTGAVPVSESVSWVSDIRDGSAVAAAPWAEVVLRICFDRSAPECASVPETLYEGINLAQLLPMPHKTFGRSDAGRYLTDSYQDENYTGLVVDLDKQVFLPVLAPEIVTPDGKMVFAGRRVDSRILATHGPVRYAQTLEAARDARFVGNNPLILRARDVTEDNQIVIDPHDAAILVRTSLEDKDFLRLGKVVLVLP